MSSVDNTSSASVTTPANADAGLSTGPAAKATIPENQKTARRRSPHRQEMVVRRSVADHHATPLGGTGPMPSPAAARTDAGRHDNSSGNDDDGLAVWTASAGGTAMEAGPAAARYLDDQVGRSLAGGKRHGLHGAARKSENKCKSDKPVHALLPGLFMRAAIIGRAAWFGKERIRGRARRNLRLTRRKLRNLFRKAVEALQPLVFLLDEAAVHHAVGGR